MVKVNDVYSDSLRTSEGTKQGSKLSGYLFNFFMNGLLEKCCNLNVGALLGEWNVSALAYCDDIILLSPVKSHMNQLLQACFDYANDWKIQFNTNKSISYSLNIPTESFFEVNGVKIPKTEYGFVYLGIPIGKYEFKLEHFKEKFSKVEKAFYSLRGIGCKFGMLSPGSIAFIYKQYCQSICTYGMETLYLDNSFLNSLNVRQNILINNAIGLESRCKTSELLFNLNVSQINHIYNNHKIFGYKQMLFNELTNPVFFWLKAYYEKTKLHCKESMFSQLSNVEDLCKTKIEMGKLNDTLEKLKNWYAPNDMQLSEHVADLLNRYDTNTFTSSRLLSMLLRHT